MLGVLGFSFKSIFIKLSYQEGLGIISIMSMRMFFSTPFFLAAYLYAFKKKDVLDFRSVMFNMGCSALYFISSVLNIAALKYIPVSIERIILFTIPVFVIIVKAFFYHEEISKKKIWLSFFSWLGVSLAFIDDFMTSDKQFENLMFGGIFVLISAISYAFFLVLSSIQIKKTNFIAFNSQIMILACFYTACLIYFIDTDSSKKLYDFSLCLYPFMLAVFSTVLPTFFLMFSLKKCGVEKSAVINNIGPFFTMLSGYFILAEQIYLNDVLGMAIVALSIYLINKK